MKIAAAVIAAIVAALPAAAPAQEKSPLAALDTKKPAGAFKLDKVLNEISGLAPAGPSSVFAHNDEFAIVHEIDLSTGDILRSFALGKPTVAGDFEAIAVSGEFIYLATSGGLIYEARPKKHRERTSYDVYDTGLRGKCEVEGLAVDPVVKGLLLLCKRSSLDPENKRLIIYRWSFAERLTKLKPWLDIALSEIVPAGAVAPEFRATELTRDAKTGNLFVVDSAAAAILELTPGGKRVGYWMLPKENHPQAEGLALMKDGAVVIGDEGGSKAGRLTVYRPRK